MSAFENAYRVIEGNELDMESALWLSEADGPELLELMSIALRVKKKYQNEAHICTIYNAKSGKCPENCAFCAQSARYRTESADYPLRDGDALLAAAEKAFQSGVRHFGLVSSGKGYPAIDSEFEEMLKQMDRLREELPRLNLCASLGILGEEPAEELSKRIVHYNHNLQVNPSNYAKLVADTHTIEERIETVLRMKKLGVKACVGAIFGLGETMRDRLELAYVLKELDVDVVPLNVLIPVKGTPLEGAEQISAMEVAKAFALYRLILPGKSIKFAAGRESVMKDWQGLLMLAGPNGFLTGGYLTTRGRECAEDIQLLDQVLDFAR